MSSCGATYDVTPSANIGNLVCRTKSTVAPATGEVYLKVLLPGGWVRGQELVVCGMVRADAIPGIVPLPGDRLILWTSRMAIERVTTGQTETGGEERPPAGASWSWCA